MAEALQRITIGPRESLDFVTNRKPMDSTHLRLDPRGPAGLLRLKDHVSPVGICGCETWSSINHTINAANNRESVERDKMGEAT